MKLDQIELKVRWINYTEVVEECDVVAKIVGNMAVFTSTANIVFACLEPSKVEPMDAAKVVSLASDELENFFQLATTVPISMVLLQPTVKEIQAAVHQVIKRRLLVQLSVLTCEKEKAILTPADTISCARRDLGQATFAHLQKIDVGPIFA